jgi:hypothetical protein
MEELAKVGRGLNRLISKNMRAAYAEKLKVSN